MKARILVSICLIAGAVAWAQTTPPSQKVLDSKAAAKPAAKPTATTAAAPAKPAPKPAAPTAHPTKTALGGAPAPAAKPAAKPAPQAGAKSIAKKPAARKPAAAVSKAVLKAPAVKREARQISVAGKRDPFVSPIRESGGTGPTCTTGKKCLAIDTVDLKGIVRMQQGMIAVVESSTRKVTFFLRENDPVFNGYVMKITLDSIVFRENVVDKAGNQSTRDVIKRVVAPAV
jgi:Tfp pilus assembly protein PilP